MSPARGASSLHKAEIFTPQGMAPPSEAPEVHQCQGELGRVNDYFTNWLDLNILDLGYFLYFTEAKCSLFDFQGGLGRLDCGRKQTGRSGRKHEVGLFTNSR